LTASAWAVLEDSRISAIASGRLITAIAQGRKNTTARYPFHCVLKPSSRFITKGLMHRTPK
jgi:hypothetical protein